MTNPSQSAFPTPPSSIDKLSYPFEEVPEKSTIMEVASGVFWIRMPLKFSLDHINLWLLDDGDGWVLVDTSMDTPDMREIWEEIIAQYCQNKPIKRVFCTHMHPDHVGLAGWLVEKFDSDLLMSRLEYLTCRVLAADTGKSAPPEGIKFYRQHDMSDAFIEGYKKMFGAFGRVIYRMPQNYTRMKDRDILTIGGRDWEMIGGNGHSPEHLCLYCADLGVFITGDQVLPKISSHIGTFPTEPASDNLTDWIESCAAIKQRVPENVLVLPAHNTPFYGLHVRLQNLIDNHENALMRLLAILETPHKASDNVLFKQLFKRKIDETNLGMALSETLSHLNCLINRGLVRHSQDEKGVLWYEAVKA